MDGTMTGPKLLDPDAPCTSSVPASIEPMVAQDVPVVTAVERACFSSAWEPSAYYNELANPAAVYYVARCCGSIVGFAGMWIAVDEAHFTLVGVLRGHRGRGIGTRLVVQLLDEAVLRGATKATLEVREHNTTARRLYEKLGFRQLGERRGYYTDTNETAIIMWADDIDTEPMMELRRGTIARLPSMAGASAGREDDASPLTTGERR
jgi:ribosomal-protein-alanine N-acetyltransferase